jgi:hypothetical protein
MIFTSLNAQSNLAQTLLINFVCINTFLLFKNGNKEQLENPKKSKGSIC